MPQPGGNPNPIYWSAEAQNFYQLGRIGTVPRLEALESLTMRQFGTGVRLFDQTGRAVPNLEGLVPKRFGTEFIDRVRESDLSLKNVYRERAAKGEYYQTLVTWTDSEGKLHITMVNNKIGRTIDKENERTRIAAAINAENALPVGERGTGDVWKHVTSVFHFRSR